MFTYTMIVTGLAGCFFLFAGTMVVQNESHRMRVVQLIIGLMLLTGAVFIGMEVF